jgi:hypothetical protein
MSSKIWMGIAGTNMLNNLPNTINTYSNLSRSTVTSLIRNMKVDKVEIGSLISRLSGYSSGNNFAASAIGQLSTLTKEVLVELFRDCSLRLSNLYSGANSAGLAIDSMVSILSSEIEKVEKDINDLELFINNYEFISGKDDLYNQNYIEKFDTSLYNYNFDGSNFSIPDRDNSFFPSNGNYFIDSISGICKMGNSYSNKNIINNIQSIKVVSNYETYTTTDSDFANLFNDNLQDSWNITIKTPNVLTANIINYLKYLNYNYSNINGAQTAIEVNLISPINIDTIRLNPNLGNGLQLLQIVAFNPANTESSNNNTSESYNLLLSNPIVLDSRLEISFDKKMINKFIFIFNQSTYIRNKLVPMTSELNSKLIQSFVDQRLNERSKKFSLNQDLVYWHFKRKNTVNGLSKNKNMDNEYYSYRFPADLNDYSRMISDEIFRANNFNLEDRERLFNSPVFKNLFYNIVSNLDNDYFNIYSNYYVEAPVSKNPQQTLNYPGYIQQNNSNNISDQKYQFYEQSRSYGTAQNAVRDLLTKESSDYYEYIFSLKSIEFLEIDSTNVNKSCFVSRKIPVDGQILAVKAKASVIESSISTAINNINLNSPISYELSISNEESPVSESSWTPIALNNSSFIDSEVVFLDTSDFTAALRFKATIGSIILYKDGIRCSANAYSFNSASNKVALLDRSIFSPNSIFCVSYILNSDIYNPYEIDFVKNNLYKDITKNYGDNSGPGQMFMRTDLNRSVSLEHTPYINQNYLQNSTYSPNIGTIFNGSGSSYNPVKIQLSDGSYAVNITNYTNNQYSSSFYNTNLTLFIQNGKNITFNRNINSSFRVFYEYAPYNLRFRFIMRKNIPNINIPGKADSILLKMKTATSNLHYNKLTSISKNS